MRYILFLFLLYSVSAWSSPPEEPSSSSIPLFETARDLLGTQANSVANRLDSFFGDQRADDELGRSFLRISSDNNFRDGSKYHRNTQFRFNLRLPSLEKKFNLKYFERGEKPSAQEAGVETTGFYISPPKNQKLDTKWLLRGDSGVSVAVPPVVFARARLRKSFATGTLIHRFVNELAWYSNRDYINTASFNTDQTLSSNVLFRFVNSAIWTIIPKKVTMGHGPTILHQLSDDDAMSYAIIASTYVNYGVYYLTNYQISMDYRRNLYRNWFYLDVIPGIDFPKSRAFERTPFIVIRLEALFGNT